jgi:hypothetical protein
MNNIFTLGDLSNDPIERQRGPLKAYCTSQVCTRYQSDKGKWAFRPYVAVEAKRGAVDCPHCKHALWWGRNPPVEEAS